MNMNHRIRHPIRCLWRKDAVKHIVNFQITFCRHNKNTRNPVFETMLGDLYWHLEHAVASRTDIGATERHVRQQLQQLLLLMGHLTKHDIYGRSARRGMLVITTGYDPVQHGSDLD